jgi:phosphatidylinositol phospholipase C delta
MGDRAVLRIPKVFKSPEDVQTFKERMSYEKEGLQGKKVKENGSFKEKTLFIDPHGSRLFYVPSFKSVQHTSMPFRNIVEISTSMDATPGLSRCSATGVYPATFKTAQGRYVAFLLTDKGDRDMLVQTVAFMVRRSRDGFDDDPRHVRIYDLWIEADRDNSGSLSMVEIIRVLRKIGVGLSVRDMEKVFAKFDADGSGQIEYGEFVTLYEYLTELEVLKPLFTEFIEAEPTSLLKPQEVESFFREAQGEFVPMSTVESMTRFYTRSEKSPGLSFSNFSAFITDGNKNSWVAPSKMTVHMDMTQPLHHYYIATSHNTFLCGTQFSSDAEPDMIGIALQQGCRVVELELWDGLRGEPQVFRGRGKRLSAKDAIRAVAESAFFYSPYPVFLILEVHCSDEQAAVLSRIVEATFGDDLVRFDAVTAASSPESLQHKVIVAYKHDLSDADAYKAIEGSAELEEIYRELNSTARPSHRTVGREELVTVAGAAVEAWHPSPSHNQPDEVSYLRILQLAETSVAPCKPDEDRLAAMSRKELVRVVPSMRKHADSSNMSLSRYLALGVPMVAINYQTYDAELRTAEAFFNQNGRCGFVLKPSHLRGIAASSTAHKSFVLTVSVISATQLPPPADAAEGGGSFDPYVVVQAGGTPRDMETNPSLQTKVIYDNSFNPAWNQTFRFVFADLDLATLSFRVFMKSAPLDKDIANASAALNAIRLGYRAVPLYSSYDGSRLPSSVIVCHFALDLVD